MTKDTEDDRRRQFLRTYRDGLLENTIPFWLRHGPDREHGGLLSGLDRDGSVYNTDKAVWIQGRFAWMMARLCNVVEKRQQWLDLARSTIDFIRRHCFDADGRMYYRVTRDGRPLVKRRYLFSECFATIALAEYALAAGDDRARDEARDLFKLVWRYHTTPGLLQSKVNPQTRPMKSHAMPMILLATVQVLRQVDNDPLYAQVARQCVQEITRHFHHPELGALLENVGPEGQFIDTPDGRTVNPGHAIESAWFLMEESRHTDDAALLQSATTILDQSLAIGWDDEYGGICYFRDVKGLPAEQYEHDMKLWWVHNEAIYATLLAFHLTGQTRYLDWHARIHDWTYTHFPDLEFGEWYGYLHRDGTVSTPLKGNMWKGPFHLPRMQLNCWKLLEQIPALPNAPTDAGR